MALKKFIKDPNAKLDYVLDWSDWLATGDTVSSAAATVSPTGGLMISGTAAGTFSNSASVSLTVTSSYLVTVWAKDGTAGSSYDITVRVTTASGRIDDRTITITCREM
jgi:hypothetical protein